MTHADADAAAQIRATLATDSGTVERAAPAWRDTPFCLSIIAIIAVIGLCISRSSLWIDEGFTAWVTTHNSIASLVLGLRSVETATSDRQYPLYVLWIWSWSRVFGHSELSLRAANLPFLAVYVLAIAVTCRAIFRARFRWIPFAFAPFVWLYVSEARSYLMLTSFATVAVGAALTFAYGPAANRRTAIWFLFSSALLTLLSHVLGIFVIPGLLVILMAAHSNGSYVRWPEWRLPTLVFGPCFLAAVVFYAFTFFGTAGRAELAVNHRPFPSLAYGAQVLYEYVGLDGLGPPRNSLRTNPRSLGLTNLPWLVLGTALIAFSILQSFRETPERGFWQLILASSVVFAFALLFSSATHTRFLGRHMAAAFPLFLFALMFLTRRRVPLLLLAAAYLLSDCRQTFLPTYWTDDYRTAVRDVVARHVAYTGSIDWVGDALTANYYGLVLTSPGDPEFERYTLGDFPAEAIGTLCNNLSPVSVETLLKKQLVGGRHVYLALSKPDVYDLQHGWELALVRRRAIPIANYRSFSIYVFN